MKEKGEFSETSKAYQMVQRILKKLNNDAFDNLNIVADLKNIVKIEKIKNIKATIPISEWIKIECPFYSLILIKEDKINKLPTIEQVEDQQYKKVYLAFHQSEHLNLEELGFESEIFSANEKV